MFKNIVLPSKNQLVMSAVAFVLVFVRGFFNTSFGSMLDVWSIILTVLMSAAFAVLLFFTYNESETGLFSAQNIIGTATVLFVTCIMFSFKVITYDIIMAVFITSLILIFAQNVILLPVVVIIALVAALEIPTSAFACIPASISVSCICFAIKKPEEKAYKIIFAICETIILALAVYSCYYMRNSLTLHSVKAEAWDSILAVLSGIILIAVIIHSIKVKKTAVEIFAYVISFATVPYIIMMDKHLVFTGTLCLFMTLYTAVCKDSAAKEVVDKFITLINKKINNIA